MDNGSPATCPTPRGSFTSQEALRLGHTRNSLAALVRSGQITRLARSWYVDRACYDAASPEQKHAMHTRAIVASFDGKVAASHYSAIALMGLPVFSADVSQVHVTRRLDDHTRRRAGLTMHATYGTADAYRLVDMTPCVVSALAVLGTATSCGVEAGVVAADAALASGSVTMVELRSWLDRLTRRTHLRWASRAVELADPRSESVGESRTRFLLHGVGLSPTPQLVIRDGSGAFVARVDLGFERERVVVEFDGLVKYAGANGRQALVAEKLREDRLRDLGYHMVRLTWADLSRPAVVEARVRHGLARGAAPRRLA